MPKKIDLILHNADIYTFDPANPQAEAVAVVNGRIVAVGSTSDIRGLDGAREADNLDLKGATLLPGLNDSHTHLLWWSLNLQELHLAGVPSLSQVVEMVRERAEQTPDGQWVRGLGWDKNLWGDAFPTKDSLDRAAPDNPVYLSSKDGHLAWVNSRALQIAGIDENTLSPEGGEVVKDEQGQPTGILKENAVGLVSHFLDEVSVERAQAALAQAIPLAHAAGLTGVHTIEYATGFAALQRLRAQKQLKLRTTVLLTNDALPHLSALGLEQGFGDEMLWLGQVKFFLDGTLGSQTAAMFEPFENSPDCDCNNCGLLRMDVEEFEKQARQTVQSGYALAVHVIGDRAARLAIDVIERLRSFDPGYQLRHRLEHLQIYKPDDLARVIQQRIIASVQPTHATTDRDAAERYWGQTRAAQAYQYKTLLQNGVPLALGSDVPIEPIDPLKGIYAAVARKRIGEDRPAWFPNQRLSPGEAIRGFSSGAAYAAGDEHRRGLIAPGMLADFTALSQNILTAPEDEIPATPIAATIVGGEVVYSDL